MFTTLSVFNVVILLSNCVHTINFETKQSIAVCLVGNWRVPNFSVKAAANRQAFGDDLDDASFS